MADAIRSAGALRDRIRIERRGALGQTPSPPWSENDVAWDAQQAAWQDDGEGDGAGNYETDWRTLITSIHAAIEPRRGGETVVAGRLQGVSAFDIWVRCTPETRAITVGDRVVDARNGARIFAIRFVENLDLRGRFLLLQCEAGVADG